MANGAPTVSNGLVISGVTTTSDIKVGTGATLNVYGGAVYSGIVTATSFSGDGATFSGIVTATSFNLDDNNKLNLGDSSDLQIYHDGSNSYITNNTGDLIIDNNASTGRAKIFTDVEFEVFVNNTDAAIKAVRAPSGGQVELYHSGNKKLETTNTGVTVTGTVAATAFTGDGSGLTGTGVGGNSSINTTGIITATAFVPTTQAALSHRNRIINGAMQIWQRGNTITSQGNGQNDYTADRWAIGHNNSHMAEVNRSNGTDAGFEYCARVQRDSGNSQTDQMRFHTALERKDVIPLRGHFLTISYYARKGADYSEANSKITGVRIATGENADGDPNLYSGGHWTNATTLLTGTPTLTTSWQRFSHVTINPVSSAANSMLIEFRHTPVGTAGGDDWYEITGIQLEIGNVPTPFEHRTYTEDIQRCRRYFQKFSAYGDHHHFGVARAEGNTARSGIVVHEPMRVSPTVACNGHRTFRGDGGYNSESSDTPAVVAGWTAESNIYTIDFGGHSLNHNQMYCLMSRYTSSEALTLDSEL